MKKKGIMIVIPLERIYFAFLRGRSRGYRADSRHKDFIVGRWLLVVELPVLSRDTGRSLLSDFE